MALLQLFLFVHGLRAHPVSEPPAENRPSPEARPVSSLATTAGIKATIISLATSPTPFHDRWAIELRKRTSLDTCGYVDGEPLTCLQPNALCSTNTIANVMGCCDPLSNCVFPTTCVPSSLLLSCTGDCATDILVTKCNDPLSPYCAEIIFPGNDAIISQVDCFSLPNVTATAYSTPSISMTAQGSPTTTALTTTPITTSSIEATSSGEGTTSAISSTPSGPNATGNKFPTDFGAGGIAGCTVGGSFVLGLFVYWTWYDIFKCKKRRKGANAPLISGENGITSFPAGGEKAAVPPEAE